MKRFLYALVLLLVVTGCATLPTTRTADVTTPIINNKTERLQLIGALSDGIDISADKKDLPAVKDLNAKIDTLAEKPTPKQVDMVVKSLDNAKDAEALKQRISKLVDEQRKLEQQQLELIDQLSNTVTTLRNEKKSIQSELDELKNPINAIKYGITTILRRFAYGLIGFGIVFLLLRIFAASNPIVGALFSVFSHTVAAIIKGLSAVFPKLLEHLQVVKQDVAEAKSSVFSKLVDEISSMKNEQSIAELKDALAKRFDESDKRQVYAEERDLGYK